MCIDQEFIWPQIVVQAYRPYPGHTTCCMVRIMSRFLADAVSMPEANLPSTCLSKHEHWERGDPQIFQVHRGIVDIREYDWMQSGRCLRILIACNWHIAALWDFLGVSIRYTVKQRDMRGNLQYTHVPLTVNTDVFWIVGDTWKTILNYQNIQCCNLYSKAFIIHQLPQYCIKMQTHRGTFKLTRATLTDLF